jgi:O-antigen/teichoic acid export membrane protein
MPAPLAAESVTALYWLAASIPAILVTSALRGMLEGLQRFKLVNLIRVPAAVVNYLGPVLVLPFGRTLPFVVAVIVVARYAVLAAYAVACARVVPPAAGPVRLEGTVLARLASFGGWLTVSNLVNPLIIFADRFVIASAVSVAAVSFYVTPYEVITKAWLVSASLMAALFPALTAAMEREPGAVRPLCRKAEIHLVAIVAPGIALVLGCADWLLHLWLGAEFSARSAPVAHLLAIGILVNIAAQVPLTALHAMGRADLTARVIVMELPVYALAVWYGAVRYGIVGVAAVWAGRAALDAALMFPLARNVLPPASADARDTTLTGANIAALCVLLAAFWLAGLFWREEVLERCAALAVLMAALLAWTWLRLLAAEDRERLMRLWNRPIA